jgi:molecular chaperone DnaJ
MDHYQVLGVSRDAGTQQIRAAYKARVRQVHPDKQGQAHEAGTAMEDASEAMVAIQAAYTTLMDAVARKQYDSARPAAGSGGKVSDDAVLAWLNGLSKTTGAPKTRPRMEDLYHDEQRSSTWSRVQFQDRAERPVMTRHTGPTEELVFDYDTLGI